MVVASGSGQKLETFVVLKIRNSDSQKTQEQISFGVNASYFESTRKEYVLGC